MIIETIYIFLSVPLFVSMLIWLGASYFFARTRLKVILKIMKNISGRTRESYSLGLHDQIFFLATIGGIMIFSKSHIKSGNVTVEELQAIPKKLKNQLMILIWLAPFFCICMVALYLMINIYDL